MKNLINRIAKIDRKAALWLARKAPRYKKGINLMNSSSLRCIMLWRETPQGHDYWREISIKLGGCKGDI